MTKKRVCLFSLLLALPLLLSGCWDKIELENRGFVNLIGIDKFDQKNAGVVYEKDAKNENRFTLSLSLPKLDNLSGAGENAQQKSVKHASSETINGAIKLVDVASSQKLYYGHTKVAIFGQHLLEDEALFSETIDAMERSEQISRKIIIVATEGDAKKTMESEITGEPLLGMYVTNFYKNTQSAAALAFKLDLETLIGQLRNQNCAIIPKVKIEDKAVKLGGAALVKDFKVIKYITDEETRGYLWLKNKAKGALVTAKDGKTFVPISISSSKTKMKFREENGKIICDASISVIGTIEEFRIDDENFDKEMKVEKLKGMYSDIILKEIVDSVELFKKYDADCLGIKEEIRKHNYDLYTKFQDKSILSLIEIRPTVTVKVAGTGATK